MRQIYFFYIFIQLYTFYLLIFLWTDTNWITREIHVVKKTREFHDNDSENISGESESFVVYSIFPGYTEFLE